MDYLTKIENLLEVTLEKGASDLHIAVGHHPILRVSKQLVRLKEEEIITEKDAREMGFALMGKERKEEFLEKKVIDFGYNYKDRARFRINVFFEFDNVSIALRVIPQEIKTLEELNLPTVIHRVTEASQGLVLVTGSTSQGKSTTLASIIDEINHNRKEHVITIEDPVEYVFKDDKSIIAQREVGRDTLSFSKALTSILREDPDVIMVGEMRDLKTISTAITAAETGHLVLATLHTNSASQSIHRMIDIFPPHKQEQIKSQLAGSLLAVLSQRLVQNKEGDLVPACETMFNTSAVANLIREGKIYELPSIIETSRKEGMIPLNRSLAQLVESDEILVENAVYYSLNAEDLRSRLRGVNSSR